MNIKQSNIATQGETSIPELMTIENDLKLYEDLANVLLKHQKRVPVASAVSTMIMALAVIADHDPLCEFFITDAYRYYCEQARKKDDDAAKSQGSES